MGCILNLEIKQKGVERMATKIEIRCTQMFKDSIKVYADSKSITMTTWIKDAIVEKMKREK